MKLIINEGSIIPHYPWYLPAYDEFRLNTHGVCVVCYPIGINLIVRWFRKFVHWAHWGRSLTKYDELDWANMRVENLTEEVRHLRIFNKFLLTGEVKE